jgi:hypothetical protein
MSYCPSQDWDRHCRDMDAPYPVGQRREVRSKKQQVCESCYGRIEPGTPHLMQTMVGGDTGLFSGAMRLHREGECLPTAEEY